ncbi:MAG TPA: cell wall hydrolase [Allosphingosinicella sp.]|jgi:spore germination cell wall hydrolase CwlJ-like protein
MTRIFRAAGLAAACAALGATATIAAPAQGQVAAIQAQPDGGLFAGLFESVAALFAGSDDVQVAAPAPAPPLADLVSKFETDSAPDPEQDCLATAIYFESRGEPIEGQLAVADVVLNRAASGRYPPDLCDVITQHAQFSFVRHGHMPMADRASEAWRKAVAIAHIAEDRLAETEVPADVLWYHATYVSPSWGKRLTRETQIGLHIFYS